MTKWSLAYEILRAFVRFLFNRFYKKVQSDGNENIPKKEPIIFAANHQNALMDPLAIIFTNPNQSVFLTRADIFDNPILLKIFSFLKMLPVYRIKDGADSLKINERIFNKSVEILEAKMSVALFPEATHTDKRHLRHLKKAVPRIAFMAEEKNDFNLNLKVVPVGIYYEDYVHTNSKLFVNYGKPLSLKPYKELAKENIQKAYIAFKNDLEEAIKKLIIHIKDLNNYDLYEGIRLFYRPIMRAKLGNKKENPLNNFKADQKTIEKLENYYDNEDNSIESLKEAYSNYCNSCKSLRIDPILWTEKNSIIILIKYILFTISIPIFIYGIINNILYYLLFTKFINKIKDKQFHSSIKFGVSFLILPFLYIIQSAVFYAFIGDFYFSLIYLISLPISAFFANKIRYGWKHFKQEVIIWWISGSKKKNVISFHKNKQILIDKIEIAIGE
jgi:1-acyl-sn-glycerol-3-phosphate acyltransferase